MATLRPITRLTLAAMGAALALTLSPAPSAQQDSRQPQERPPRFRAGANLVRLDAYVSANGQAVTDLKQEDFEVLEDGAPQKVESFEIIRPRPPSSRRRASSRTPLRRRARWRPILRPACS